MSDGSVCPSLSINGWSVTVCGHCCALLCCWSVSYGMLLVSLYSANVFERVLEATQARWWEQLSPHTPECIRDLLGGSLERGVKGCLSDHPSARPSFAEVVAVLRGAVEDSRRAPPVPGPDPPIPGNVGNYELPGRVLGRVRAAVPVGRPRSPTEAPRQVRALLLLCSNPSVMDHHWHSLFKC